MKSASNTNAIGNASADLRNRAAQRPELVDQARTAEQMATAGRQEAARLDAAPYERGNASAIQAAQAKVDGFKRQLAKAQADYTSGVQPFTTKLAAVQATYDATMAPFESAVRNATGNRSSALQQAGSQTQAAAARLAQSEKELHQLKEDSPGIKWSAPKWLGGWGFSTKDFWAKQPAVK